MFKNLITLFTLLLSLKSFGTEANTCKTAISNGTFVSRAAHLSFQKAANSLMLAYSLKVKKEYKKALNVTDKTLSLSEKSNTGYKSSIQLLELAKTICREGGDNAGLRIDTYLQIINSTALSNNYLNQKALDLREELKELIKE